MNFGWLDRETVSRRIPVQRNTVDRITEYGSDNLYPERMKQTLLVSPVAKAAVQILADFIMGEGFTNGDIMVNETQTANDILRLIAWDRAFYNGYALQLNSTGIGVVKEVNYIPFEYCRLGLADQRGRIKDVRVSNNWEQADNFLPKSTINEIGFQLFDAEQNGREALTTSKGMVLYSTPKENQYPLSQIDAIIETCESDYKLQQYEKAQLTNGFLGLTLVKFPSAGDLESQDARMELSKKLNELKGAENASSILVVGVDEDAENINNLIETVPSQTETLFVQTTINVKERIMQNASLPASLMGVLPTGSFITATQIADDFTYTNLRTKRIRQEIERQFDKLGLNLGTIIPNQFDSSTMKENEPIT